MVTCNFSQFSVNRHFGCFQTITNTSDAVVNNLIQMSLFLCQCVFRTNSSKLIAELKDKCI